MHMIENTIHFDSVISVSPEELVYLVTFDVPDASIYPDASGLLSLGMHSIVQIFSTNTSDIQDISISPNTSGKCCVVSYDYI